MKTYVRFVFLAVLLALFSAPAVADVCDELQDATPGLYGLCNAFCEAQDCDSYAAGDEPNSCNRLLANYNLKRTDSDPEMPCAATVCPCWGEEELVAGGMTLDEGLCQFNNGSGLEIASWTDFTDTILFRVDEVGDATSCSYANSLTGDSVSGVPTDPDQNAECRAGLHALQFEFAFCLGL